MPSTTNCLAASRKGSLLHYGNRDNIMDQISISKHLVFIRDRKTNSFYTKLKIVNQSPRFVSYRIQPSNSKHFYIQPNQEAIAPRAFVEVIVSTTRHVRNFYEIFHDSFSVFAVPIYDKRNLEKTSLTLLWKAHGTELFPYESSENHVIASILPKRDYYMNDCCSLWRIPFLQHLFGSISKESQGPTDINANIRTTEEEPFLLDMLSPDANDKYLKQCVADWHSLTEEVNTYSNAVVESAKITVISMVSGGLTMLGMGILHYHGFITIFAVKPEPEPVSTVELIKAWVMSWIH